MLTAEDWGRLVISAMNAARKKPSPPGSQLFQAAAGQAIMAHLRSLADAPESGVSVVEAYRGYGLAGKRVWYVTVPSPGSKLVLDWEEK